MVRSGFSKAERKELRELAEKVYEAEARSYLEELDRDFAQWRNGKMTSADLLTSIHHFHRRQNRDLWKMYQGISDGFVVERGLDLGLIDESKISPTLLAKLREKGGEGK